METKFTHFDEQGNAVMVDVSEKNPDCIGRGKNSGQS